MRVCREARALGVRATACALLLAGLLLFAACSGDSPSGNAAEAYEIQEAYENGLVSLTLKVSRREITAADRIELVLEALAPEQEQIEFPAFDEKLEEFQIVNSRTSAPRLVEGRAGPGEQVIRVGAVFAGEIHHPSDGDSVRAEGR